MTPIYRSPDQSQTKAIQTLLLDHQIQTSIIESKKSDSQFNAPGVVWYELWLKNYSELKRARSIITQQEFTAYNSHRSSVNTAAAPKPEKVDFTNTIELLPTSTHPASNDAIMAEESRAPLNHQPGLPMQKRRDDLIPINNKRVFKRLGLLLGFSEEEIEKTDNNKLYRPWDADTLMETVKNLKQKCS